jgi:hypothetical protein
LRAFRRSKLSTADGSFEPNRGSRRFGAQGLAVAARLGGRFRGGFAAVLTAENRPAPKKSATFRSESVALGVSCGRFALK